MRLKHHVALKTMYLNIQPIERLPENAYRLLVTVPNEISATGAEHLLKGAAIITHDRGQQW